MRFMFTRMLSKSLLLILFLFSATYLTAQTLPTGFSLSDVGSGWTEPVGTAFNSTGSRMFVWEKAGKVYVCNWDAVNKVYVKQSMVMLNIAPEVGNWRDFGMLGFALDPNFDVNGLIYVMYVVDRHFLLTGGLAANGYSASTNTYFSATIGRITRYQTAVSGGNLLAVPASRTILLGESKTTGIPILHESHGVGSLAFAADGTLLATAGDGASYDDIDSGGTTITSTYWNQALNTDHIITPSENVGAFRAQMITSLNGKVLRLDPTNGNGVSSNPFYDAAAPRSAKSRVWALGLRNPFRMSVRPNTGSTNPATGDIGEIYVTDVGWSDIEELNIIKEAGTNCGWPLYEGMRTNSAYETLTTKNKDELNPLFGSGGCTQQYFTFRNLLKQATADNIHTVYNPCNGTVPIASPNDNRFFHRLPVLDWNHDFASTRVPVFLTNNFTPTEIGTVASGVTGTPFQGICASAGCWYTYNNKYPPQYTNTFFAADLMGSAIRNFTIQFTDVMQKVTDFSTGYSSVVHLNVSPADSCVYITDIGDAVVRKINYGGNQPPVPKMSSNITYGPAPLTVNFTGNTSYDPDGPSVTYSWNFGDGTATSVLANPVHVFTTSNSNPKKFVVKLTVKDNKNATSVDSIIISANNTPPVVSIISPVDNSLYIPGLDTAYTLEAVVTDAEHTPAQLKYAWQTILKHNSHQHTEPIDTDPLTSSVISRIGCNGDSYHWLIKLTVTDPAGLFTVDSSSIFPYCGPPLPVKLSSFNVLVQGRSNILSWYTADELNLKQYEIERSYDGRNFETIGAVNAHTIPNSKYEFTDDNFLDGYIYYRLKMTDIDSKYAYSFIVRVYTGTKANNELTISPNPFKDEFLFAAEFKKAGNITIRIIDAKGAVVKTIKKQVSIGFNSFQVDKLGNISKGVYFLEVSQGDELRKMKMIKEN